MDTNLTTTENNEAAKPDSIYTFSSLALTDEYNLKLEGCLHAGDYSEDFVITRYCKPHPDLLKCLRRLTLHMCLLTENLTDTQLYPAPADSLLPVAVASRNLLREAIETGEAFVHEALENFRCTSVVWKSKGVVLKGERRARYRTLGRSLKVETPCTLVLAFAGEEDVAFEEWEYPFFESMANALNELRAEMVEFMNGKYGEGGEQLSLFGKDAPAEEDAEQGPAGKFVGFMQELAQDKGLTIEVSSNGRKRTFGGKELED